MLITINSTYLHLFEIPVIVFLLNKILHELYSNGFSIKLQAHPYTLPFISSMFIFTLSFFSSMIFAQKPELAFKDAIKWIEIDLIIIALFLYLKNIDRFKRFYWLLFLSCFLFIAEAIIHYFSGTYINNPYRIFPAYESALAFALLLPFVREKAKLLSLLAFLCFASAFFSLSRGAWIALTFVIIYYFKYIPVKGKTALILFMALFLIVSYAIEPIRSYILLKAANIFSTGDASNLERIRYLKLAWDAFLSSPIFGIGGLNLYDYMVKTGFEGIKIKDIDVANVHNTFLQIAAEEGLFGLIAFVIMIGCILGILIKRQRLSCTISAYRFGLINFYIVMTVNLIFGYISSQFRFFIALHFGLILALLRICPKGKENEQ